MGKALLGIVGAMVMMGNLLLGREYAGYSLRRDPFGKGKRKVGHKEGIIKDTILRKVDVSLLYEE